MNPGDIITLVRSERTSPVRSALGPFLEKAATLKKGEAIFIIQFDSEKAQSNQGNWNVWLKKQGYKTLMVTRRQGSMYLIKK